MKYIISAVLLVASIFGGYSYFTQSDGVGGGLGTIEQLGQWFDDGTYLTQNVAGRLLKLTGYESSGDCLVTDASGVVSTAACGSGGGGGSNWSILSGGLRTSTSTDFAQAAYFVASSTTATSTFAGRLSVSGTTTLATTSGVFYDRGGAQFNVMNYGARCNGTTNDSTAINSAISAANGAGGGIVLLCAGTHFVSGQIIPMDNVALVGRGQDATIILANRPFDYALYYSSTTKQLQNFAFGDFSINVNNVANSSGVALENVKGTKAFNLRIYNVPAGGWNMILGSPISSTTTIYNEDNLFSDVIFDTHTGTLEQFLIYNSSSTDVVRPIFRNNTYGGGVQVAFGLWQHTEDTNIIDAKFYSNVDTCFYYSITTNNTRLINPTFHGCGNAIQGANISDNGRFGETKARGLYIENPIIVGASTTGSIVGIQLGAVDNVLITNPVISNMQIGILIGGGNNEATSTSATNWTISNPIIYNNNVSADFHAIHPGIYIKNPGNESLYGLIYGGKIYDNYLGNQRFPITFGGNTVPTVFENIIIRDNRLSAATTSGGTSITLQDGAIIGSSTVIRGNTDYSGTNPAQTAILFSEVGGATSGSVFFASSTGALWQSATNFFWNNTLGRLGIGTSSPQSRLTVQGSGQLVNIGDTTTNDSATKLLIQNRWTGNESASIAVQGNTGSLSPHFYVGGGGRSAFGTTSTLTSSRLTVWGTGSTDASSNFSAVNNSSSTLFEVFNGGRTYIRGFLGVGTDTPATMLQVVGTTTLATTSVSSLSVGSLSGLVRATAGTLATSLVSLTSDIAGILGITNGGTGTSTAPGVDTILVGNGANYDLDRLVPGANITFSSSTPGQFQISASASGGSNWTIASGGLRTSTSTDFAQAANFIGTSTSAFNTFAGRVGIGTTTPTAGLSVQNYVGNALLEVGNFDTNDSRTKVLIRNRWSDNTGGSLVVQGVNATTPHFYVGGGGFSAFGTSTSLTSRLTVWGSGITNSSSNFLAVNNSSTTLFEIKNGGQVYMLGNVGIGTTTPSTALSVVGTTTLATTSITALSDITGSIGSNGQVLLSTGTSTVWVATSSLGISGGGGFSDPLTTNGDIIARISGATTRLAQGGNGTFLGVSGGVLGYYTPAGGGGGGGALSTTTDIVGDGGLQDASYVTGDVMFGGSSSTTAEFQFDDDGGKFIISSSSANATATIESNNNAQAVRLGDDNGAGLEYYFGVAGDAIIRGYGAVTEVLFQSSIGSSTLSVSAATSSPQHGTNLVGFVQSSLARIAVGLDSAIGYLKSGRFFGALTVNGLIFQESWNQVDCSSIVGAVQIAADAVTGCDGISFYEDTTSTLTSTTNGGNIYARLSTSAVNDGAGVFLNAPSAGGLIIATSTPIMEVTARLHSVQNQGTTTQTFIGFTNIASAGTAYEVATGPSIGCFFTASSTQANWKAVCKTAAATQTIVDTGIASTSVVTGDGVPYHFIIETGTSSAKFYIQSSEAAALTLVAEITTNVPNTTALNAGVYFGRISMLTAVGVDVYDMNIGWRKMLAR